MDAFARDVEDKTRARLEREFVDFQRLYANELEEYLASCCRLEGSSWCRDYTSEEAYLQSIAGNREAWRDILGTSRFEADGVDGPPESWPLHRGDDYEAHWVHREFLPGVISRYIVAKPATVERPLPVVICQHGVGSSPFHVLGYMDPDGSYNAYAMRLLEAGFAVIAPANRTTAPGRSRLERIAHLLDTTLYGLECYKLDRIIDAIEEDPDLDGGRVGMSGLSLGGAATLLFTPAIERIQAACCAAWFLHRRSKMVLPSPRYVSFLETGSEHQFIPGLLPEFSDSDLVSLICPRPFMAQHGKSDGIAWWPLVEAEWAASHEHYEKLGIPERAELVLHESGHEILPSRVIPFFKKWL